MSKQKLIIITSSYYPRIGGVEKHVRNVTKKLKLKYNIAILVAHDSAIPSRQVIDGVPIIRLPKKPDFKNLLLWRIRNPSVLKAVQLIHSHDYYLESFRKLLPNAAWFHTFHGYEGYPIPKSAIKIRTSIRKAVSVCFCVGAFIEKWYHTKCEGVFYGAVEQKNAKASSKKLWDIVFVGRLEKDTGFTEYLRAFNELSNAKKLSMLIVGSGSLLEWAKKYITSNNLNVKLIPASKNAADYLGRAQVAFVSGYLTILEAAINKVPIVAQYNNPLKHDYLQMHPQHKNMYIVQRPQEITQAFQAAILQRSVNLDEFKKWAKKQTWQSIADTYSSCYQKELS